MTRGEWIQLQVNVRLCWCDIRLYHHLLSTSHRQGNGPNISASHAEGNFIQNRLINRWDSYDRSRLESRWHLHGSRIRAEIFSHVMLSLSCVSTRYQADYQTNFPSEKLSCWWTGSKAGWCVHCPGGRKVGNCEILGQYFTLVVRPSLALVQELLINWSKTNLIYSAGKTWVNIS